MNQLDRKLENLGLGVIAIAVSAMVARAILASQKETSKVPVIPYSFPFIGSTFAYYTNPLAFTKANTSTYGSVFQMHLHGALNTVVGAEDAPEVFANPDLSFTASQSKFFDQSIFHRGHKFTLPDSVIRDSIMKHLTPNLKEYDPRSFERFLKESGRLLGDLTEPKTIPNLLPLLRSFVARYSACAFVGPKLSNDEKLINAFEHAVTDIGKELKPGVLRVIFPFLNTLYMRVFYRYAGSIGKYREMIKGALEKELYAREASDKKNSDLLQYLLDEYPHDIDNDHLETLTTVILLFIFVGVHTTTDAVTYCIYSLAKHPEYIAGLYQEQQEVMMAESHEMTPSAYRRMPKLDSFIRESLRVRSVGIGHAHKNISKNDIVLKSGAIIKPDQEVFINVWHIHNDKVNQSHMSHLDEFDGFRFVDHDKLVTKAGPDNVSFGMGKHACPGRWFATHQIKGIMSHFLRNYNMKAITAINVGGQDGYTGPPNGAVEFSKK